MKQSIAFVALAVMLATTALAATVLTPSALSASARQYVGQRVSVTGVVRNLSAVQGRRAFARYQLCDMEACVNVVQFGTSDVETNVEQTANGTMRRMVVAGRYHVQNAIVIGRP